MANNLSIPMPVAAEDLRALLKEVNKEKPDPGAVAALRSFFRTHPAVCDEFGNLALMATNALAERTFGDRGSQEAVLARLEQMRDELGYSDASELERGLIRHLILCWLRLHDAELKYHMATGDSQSLTQALFWEKKLSQNQRRYLRACDTLARVQRLLVKPTKRNYGPEYLELVRQQLGGKREK